jgi:molybdate transport system substrate-binding protein
MRIFFILLFTLLSLQAQNVTVALAANVSYAIADLKNNFLKKYPQAEIEITVGGSGKLATQIQHGAPYDIFLSANMEYPLRLYKESMTLNKPQVYACGALALLSKKERKLDENLSTLNTHEIHTIAVANPKTAPYGKAAKEALENVKLYKKLQKRFIYGESISQTLLYTLRAADVGFIAKSALFAPQLRKFQKNKNWVEVEKRLYKPIQQGAVLLKHAQDNTTAEAFYNYLFSKEAQMIFAQYGYTLP